LNDAEQEKIRRHFDEIDAAFEHVLNQIDQVAAAFRGHFSGEHQRLSAPAGGNPSDCLPTSPRPGQE
jgi:hypothetical protein